MINEKEMQNNYENYYKNETDISDYKNIPFYHQIASGKGFIGEVSKNPIRQIIQDKHLYNYKKLRENNIEIEGGTLSDDIENGKRDGYVYLNFGTVVAPTSRKYITIEIPQNNIINKNVSSFFANDFICFAEDNESRFQDWKNSIIKTEDGIPVLIKFIESQFNGKFCEYVKGKGVGDYSKIRKDHTNIPKNTDFIPEIAVLDKINIEDSNIIIHMIGYTDQEFKEINNLLLQSNFISLPKMQYHENSEIFIDYMISKYGIINL